MHIGDLGVDFRIQSLDNIHKLGQQNKQQDKTRQHTQDQWSPYEDNGGTVLGVGGKGFCIIAGDTRLSRDYSVMSRNTSKIARLTDKTFIASSGMYADFTALTKHLSVQLTNYKFNLEKEASTQSIAQLLSNMLYQKRFFPFYCFSLLGGLDDNNNGVVYGYDAIGSGELRNYQVQGSGQQLIFPVLDNQIQQYNKINKENILESKQKCIELIVDVFNSAAERDIKTGDQIEMIIIESSGTSIQYFPLRKD